MAGPKKQDFCPRINMLQGNFDTNYFTFSFTFHLLSLLLSKIDDIGKKIVKIQKFGSASCDFTKKKCFLFYKNEHFFLWKILIASYADSAWKCIWQIISNTDFIIDLFMTLNPILSCDHRSRKEV